MSYGVGHRHGLGPELLWLWRRLAATGPIRLLAWELPYAADVAFFFFHLSAISWAAPAAYGGSQARG